MALDFVNIIKGKSSDGAKQSDPVDNYESRVERIIEEHKQRAPQLADQNFGGMHDYSNA